MHVTTRRDNVPKNSASLTNRVFKKLRVKTRDDYDITPSEGRTQYKVCLSSVKEAAGASPINTLLSSLSNRCLEQKVKVFQFEYRYTSLVGISRGKLHIILAALL